jgi:hypothetical protein
LLALVGRISKESEADVHGSIFSIIIFFTALKTKNTNFTILISDMFFTILP